MDTAIARPELLLVADAVAREKSIDRDEVLEAMEQAIQKAGRAKYGHEKDIRATIDRKTGDVRLSRWTEAVETVENEETQIPVNIAKPIMQQAVAGQALQRPWMGLYYVPVNRSVADTNKLPIDYGAWINAPDDTTPAILSGSPADTAGLKDGDIITDVNGTRIDGTTSVDEVLSQFKPGDIVTLTVLRDGQTIQVPLTLGVRPAGS